MSFTASTWVVPTVVDPALQREAQSYAVALQGTMQPIQPNALRQWLSLLGTLVAGQMKADDARTKMAALTEMLQDYPACVFTKETLDTLAKKCKWLPSYSELCEVLDARVTQLDGMLSRAKQIAAITSKPERPERFDIPKAEWDADHWNDYVTSAENMAKLAEENPMLDKAGWESIAEQRRAERDATPESRVAA